MVNGNFLHMGRDVLSEEDAGLDAKILILIADKLLLFTGQRAVI